MERLGLFPLASTSAYPAQQLSGALAAKEEPPPSPSATPPATKVAEIGPEVNS